MKKSGLGIVIGIIVFLAGPAWFGGRLRPCLSHGQDTATNAVNDFLLGTQLANIANEQAGNLVNNLPRCSSLYEPNKSERRQSHLDVYNDLNTDDPQNPYWIVQIFDNSSGNDLTFAWVCGVPKQRQDSKNSCAVVVSGQ